MSCESAATGLLERLRSVRRIKTVEPGLPTGVHASPSAFIELDLFGNLTAGQVPKFDWTFVVHVFVDMHDLTIAETTIYQIVDDILAALAPSGTDAAGHKYPTLGGRVEFARATDGRAGGGDGYVEVGGKLYRRVLVPVIIRDRA